MAKLLMTVDQMADREAWLQARQQGIGGSDAAVIVGLNPWKSAYQLWLEKTGQVEPDDLSDNEIIYWGTVLEDVVAREFTRRTGKSVRRRGLVSHCRHKWLLASVDRMVDGENSGLECKTANAYAAKDWEDDKLPDAYYCQCQHYMMVTGCDRWYIAVLIGGQKFVWKEIPRNEADIEALFEAEREFWRLVVEGEMPPVDGSEGCKAALDSRWKETTSHETFIFPEAMSERLARYDELTALEKDVKGQIDTIKNEMRLAMGEHETGVFMEDNGRKVTWKYQAGKTTIDAKRLQEEKPDIFKAYSRTGKPSRILRIA